MTKIEKLLRSDYARHFLLAFFAISLLMWAEILWKIRRQTPIEILGENNPDLR